MQALAYLIYPFYILFVLIRGLLRLLVVPLHLGLLKLSRHLGVLRLPLLLITLPIHALGILLAPRTEGTGRILEGDVIRPTFTLPYAFVRGPWQVAAKQDYRLVRLELGGTDEGEATLEIQVAPPIEEIRKHDEALASMIEKGFAEPPQLDGMRWAGLRVQTFTGALTCVYLVWKDDAPEESCVQITFKGHEAHEAAADDFVGSVLPSLPDASREAEGDATGPEGVSASPG
jgi:hypothetical protein